MLVDQEALQEFIDESLDALQTVESDFIQLEKDPGNTTIINAIFRPVHSLKGSSGFFGLTNINKFSHRLENLLDRVRKGEIGLSKEIVDLMLKGVEILEEMLHRAREDASDTAFREHEEELLKAVENFQPEAAQGTITSLRELARILVEASCKGVDIHSYSMISDLLDQVEKLRPAIESLLSKIPDASQTDDYPLNAVYRFQGNDISETIRVLLKVRLSLLERKPASAADCKGIVKSIEEMKGLMQERLELVEQLDELEGLANFLDDQLMMANQEFIDSVRTSIESLLAPLEKELKPEEEGGRLGEILVGECKISPQQLDSALKKQKKVGEILVEEGAISQDDLKKAVSKQSQKALTGNKQEASSTNEKTIRINQSKIDQFAEAIGELFINLDSFNYLKKIMELENTPYDLMSKFTSTVTTFDDMVSELHNSVMEIRKVPFNTLVQRFPKVVRQLAASVSKEVDLVIKGETTVIDKDLIEKIDNPLVHILRNSLDHGIEMPDRRVELGKKRQGRIEIDSWTDEDFVYINIVDDGAGIDPAKMKSIALKKGTFSEEELDSYNDSQLINLIFAPGFSSAEKVTDISGRGVGMDVVLSGLRSCNGTINVSSVIGQGTTINIKIPLTKTLVAKDAMIVQVGQHILAMDSRDISTTMEANVRITDLHGEQRTIQVNGKPHRVVDLHSFFFPGEERLREKDLDDAQKVFVVSETHKLAMLADQVLSHQKIVVKDFQKSYFKLRDITGVNGYSILGNQDIALIVDINGVADNA